MKWKYVCMLFLINEDFFYCVYLLSFIRNLLLVSGHISAPNAHKRDKLKENIKNNNKNNNSDDYKNICHFTANGKQYENCIKPMNF